MARSIDINTNGETEETKKEKILGEKYENPNPKTDRVIC
jgi:hypothetical protein